MTIRPATNLHMSLLEWALLLILSLLWGGAFLFGTIALAEMPPFTIVFCRVALAAIALILIAVVTRQKILVGGNVWLIFVALGALSITLPSALMLWSQTHIGIGRTSLLAATSPLFTVVVAHFFTSDEKMTAGRLFGIILATAGVAVAMEPSVSDGGNNLLAEFAVLGAALCQALAGVLARRLKQMPVLSVAIGQLFAASLLSLPLALAFERPWALAPPSAITWAAILAVAILSTALGYLIFFRLLARSGAVNVALVSLLVPVTALFLAGLILEESLNWRIFAGAALISCGLAALDKRISLLMWWNIIKKR
ncbi:DMT family transporter [Reyranella sp.]|uniref:DMT family transporter n=1 Tax=Reyranella sp. TaxID=1929291 RepID=UPI00272F8F45|nr:DMT family transporter [Reyranella sp.]MDP2372678.1 DMT family transporter [Reyranella sp.]